LKSVKISGLKIARMLKASLGLASMGVPEIKIHRLEFLKTGIRLYDLFASLFLI
jgi:hypothetical protein